MAEEDVPAKKVSSEHHPMKAFRVKTVKKLNLHVDVLRGRNAHHAAEAVFKATARALRQAVALSEGAVLSTKGTLTA